MQGSNRVAAYHLGARLTLVCVRYHITCGLRSVAKLVQTFINHVRLH